MATIELRGLAHAYGGPDAPPAERAVHPTDLAWADGETHALLGPSGCGKTTLLNAISGLLRPTAGRILFDGVDVTDAPTRDRNVAQVFQFPVVYDTMTVFGNLAFPLRNRGVDEGDVRRRVGEVADVLELTGDLRRRARGLSTDAKQRLALGRGLVREDVAAILLDEPLTVIDPALRWSLRRRLREVHLKLRPTLIHVTHDQSEALTIADRVVVMDSGSVLQVGTPRELIEAPAHTFVATFLGSPGMNLLPCTLSGEAAAVGESLVPLPPELAARARAAREPLQLGVRPAHLELVTEGAGGDCGAGSFGGVVPMTVERVDDVGHHWIANLRLGRHDLALAATDGPRPGPGDRCRVRFPAERLHLFAGGVAV